MKHNNLNEQNMKFKRVITVVITSIITLSVSYVLINSEYLHKIYEVPTNNSSDSSYNDSTRYIKAEAGIKLTELNKEKQRLEQAFVDEVAGKGTSKKQGYGNVSRSIEDSIQSISHQIDSILFGVVLKN